MNGPDMNGQPVRLRGSDGISLSKAGKRKVAFYVEKPLNKLLGSETVPAHRACRTGNRRADGAGRISTSTAPRRWRSTIPNSTAASNCSA